MEYDTLIVDEGQDLRPTGSGFWGCFSGEGPVSCGWMILTRTFKIRHGPWRDSSAIAVWSTTARPSRLLILSVTPCPSGLNRVIRCRTGCGGAYVHRCRRATQNCGQGDAGPGAAWVFPRRHCGAQLSGRENSIFSNSIKSAGQGFDTSRDYDSTGRQIMTEVELTFDSINRFKGQEAPAVIMVDVDPRAERLEREERLLFCGMTRATVRLELVVNRENHYNRRFIEK